MPHVIRCFDKIGGTLVGEVILKDIALDKLQELFHMPPEDPMYEMFPIHEKEAKFFYDLAKIELNISKYNCYLDYDA